MEDLILKYKIISRSQNVPDKHIGNVQCRSFLRYAVYGNLFIILALIHDETCVNISETGETCYKRSRFYFLFVPSLYQAWYCW